MYVPNKVRVFVPGKPIQPSPMFGSKALAHPSGAPIKGRLWALPANIILVWKGLPGTNTLTY